MGIVWVKLTIRGSHYWGVPENPIEIEIGGFFTHTPMLRKRCKEPVQLDEILKFPPFFRVKIPKNLGNHHLATLFGKDGYPPGNDHLSHLWKRKIIFQPQPLKGICDRSLEVNLF